MVASATYNKSIFRELTDRQEISRLLQRHLPEHLIPSKSNYGLSCAADFTTSRSTYRANSRFTVVLDNTNFGHSIGEVELLVEEKNGTAAAAHDEIDSFMENYRWFFKPTDKGTKVEGKLEAWFRSGGFNRTTQAVR